VSTACPDDHVWVRYERWWHVAYGVIVAVTAAALVPVGGLSPGRRIAAAALLGALVVAYLLAGVPALHRTARPWPYLAVMTVLFIGMVGCAPQAAILLFILCPQVFAITDEFRHAMGMVVVLTVAVALASVADAGWTGSALLTSAGIAAISLTFSALIGFYIDRIIRQSSQRAELIEQLRAAQEELAVAHHEAGVAAERQRLATEIHDTLAQGFTSLLMLVQAAESEIDRDGNEARRYLRLAERTARENLHEARSLVAALTPAPLQGATLREAMARIVGRFAEDTGVRAELRVEGDPRTLPSAAEVVLLRTAQEALNNVGRHAAASAVTVLLSYADEGASVRVSDDGRGFEPAQISGGFGLRGMRSRVEQAGGEVTVDSEPGAGTTVLARLA
jgi:signal transduction histidine kinase